jgi:hypothetical protein
MREPRGGRGEERGERREISIFFCKLKLIIVTVHKSNFR